MIHPYTIFYNKALSEAITLSGQKNLEEIFLNNPELKTISQTSDTDKPNLFMDQI